MRVGEERAGAKRLLNQVHSQRAVRGAESFSSGDKAKKFVFFFPLLISYHLHDVRVGLPPDSIFVRFKLISRCAHLKDVGWLMEARCTFPSAASEAQYGVISLR